MTINTPDSARYEVKFVGRDRSLQGLLNWVRLHPAQFTSRYPDRYVNNIYLDTYNQSAYYENLAGVSSRSKVRYRWYGEDRFPGPGILEVKLRRNCYGWKLSFPVGNAPFVRNDAWNEIYKRIRSQVSTDGKVWLDANPFPVLLNRYYRRYFVNADSTIRVTVDTGLQTWDQRLIPSPNFNNGVVSQPVVIVEFKFDRMFRAVASEALQGFPIRVSKNSKYVTGLQSLSASII